MPSPRVLVPYSDLLRRGSDLSVRWGDYIDRGACLVMLTRDVGQSEMPVAGRVLAKGRIVR